MLKQYLTAGLFMVGLISTALVASDYHATDDMGTRIFSKVPAPGIHPRIIMSPEDLAPWRDEVANSYRGKKFFATRYVSKRIDQLANISPEITGEALIEAYPYTDPGSNHELLYATIDAIYHQDTPRAAILSQALSNFARVIIARSQYHPKWGKITENIGGITGNSGIRTGLGELWLRGGADFALAYDYLYNVMTPKQRTLCREALSIATKDLVCWGMHFPRGRGISNWYGYHGELGIMLLAIEGEEGFRADQWEAFQQMIRDWAEVHFYENGGSNEDGYSINTSMREGQFTLLAMARRGENHYSRPNIQNYFKWIVLSLVPGEDSGETVGYSSNRAAPYESAPVLARWAMPGNPIVNYYFWRYKGEAYDRQNRWQYGSWSTLLGMNWERSESLPLEMGELGLPITHVFPYQGLFITRSDWSDDASYLNLLARHDAWYDRHENVDRGRFVFAALGRRWAVDNPWGLASQSNDHSLVHIDGVAQSEKSSGRGKAPNANLIAHGDIGTDTSENGVFSYAMIDLSNAYNWVWAHNWDHPGEGWQAETRSFEEIGWPWKRPGQPDTLHGSDDRSVPKFNFEGMNLWRKAFNPVQYAWRSGLLIRGEQPYTIIVDNVKKDDATHTYTWQMPIADDLEFIPISRNQFLLVEQAEETVYGRPVLNSRRLLVTCMGHGAPEIRLEEYAASFNRGKAFKARKIVVSNKDNKGHFRIVLTPFQTTQEPTGKDSGAIWKQSPYGAELPSFSPANEKSFFIKANGVKDAWTITTDPDGRPQIHLQRGGKSWEL